MMWIVPVRFAVLIVNECYIICLHLNVTVTQKRYRLPILVTEHWARS